MFTIETPRLVLAPTPLDVLKTRLECDDFVAVVPVEIDSDGQRVTEMLRVRFPTEWRPGPKAQPDRDAWDGTIIDRAELLAVGTMGFKAPPDETGTVELGYSVNASYQGRGYATEMAQALVAWALRQPTVRRVTAECLEDNPASIRVLEKSGFVQSGRRKDEEGPLLLWERKP